MFGYGLDACEPSALECFFGFAFARGDGVVVPLLREDFLERFFVGFGFEEGFRGYGAVGGVLGDVFHCVAILLFGQVAACDLHGVEEEAGAFGVEGVGGDAAGDLRDGGLDGAAVFEQWQVKGRGWALWGERFWGSGGVVVVAK